MDLENLRHLGRLGKPWGHRGELALQLDGTALEQLLGLGVLIAEIDGQRVPFFVRHFREHPRLGAVVAFEDLDDPQSAGFLTGCAVYAPPGKDLDPDPDEEDELDPEELIGMQVMDEEHGLLGEITGLEGTEEHPVLVVRKDGDEVLIPMVEDMITGIDLESGHLVVRTPPGLVELYRGS